MARVEKVTWTPAAQELLAASGDPLLNSSIRLKAEKRCRRENGAKVLPEHVQPFLDRAANPAPVWSAAALARLTRVPEMVRSRVRRRVEAAAAEAGLNEISPELAGRVMAESRAAMGRALESGGHPSRVGHGKGKDPAGGAD
ncbi:MAG TPA: hypothetical protein ENK15_05455 [Thermopetrobacter sp.]|nr:hypothetical protein [Thermopetrobacter sp.]